MIENDPKYRRTTMPDTPGGNEVRKVDGTPDVIAQRAAGIIDLGEKMTQAATTLSLFADGSLGQGKSLEEIRKQAKEVYEDLRIAGERYTPSGEVLAAYAEALDTMQDTTDPIVDNAESAWEDVKATSATLLSVQQEQDNYDRTPVADDGGSAGDRPDSSAEQGAFVNAVTSWESYWLAYDAPFETWDDAYGVARDGLEDVNENGVEDGFWDKAMPFVEGLITVMTFVGLFALVLAVILTGPLAAIAAAVMIVASLVVLAAEASKFLADRGSGKDLTLAIVGVVPFGKLTKLSKTWDEFPTALKKMDETAQKMFKIDKDAWTGVHGLNTRNMLRTFSLGNMRFNKDGKLNALAGLGPNDVPASLADALAHTAQGVANTLVGAGAADSLTGGAG